VQKTAYLPDKTLQMIGVTADILFQAGKQFSAVTPVICKACQIGNQSSAVTPVICEVCQASKQFSAIIPVICRMCPANIYLFEKL
jgi:hypothetical protein